MKLAAQHGDASDGGLPTVLEHGNDRADRAPIHPADHTNGHAQISRICIPESTTPTGRTCAQIRGSERVVQTVPSLRVIPPVDVARCPPPDSSRLAWWPSPADMRSMTREDSRPPGQIPADLARAGYGKCARFPLSCS